MDTQAVDLRYYFFLNQNNLPDRMVLSEPKATRKGDLDRRQKHLFGVIRLQFVCTTVYLD